MINCSATDALCKDLVQGLHAASQPLTILRASLTSPDIAGKAPEDLQRLLKQSAKEVERLCLLFSYLQQFVLTESIPAESEIEDVPRLLMHAVEGVDVLFAEAGVGLAMYDIERLPRFSLLDSSRFEQALSAILLVVLDKATRGDEVGVARSQHGTSVQIYLRQAPAATAATAAMAADARLSMALAAASLRSQGSELTWQEHPFTAQIAFPITQSPVQA